MHKNNLRRHSPQQNKKNRVDDSCLFQSLYSRMVLEIVKKKECFWYKTEKVNTTIEFCMLELI